MSNFGENRRARVERVSDADPHLLQFFADNGIGYGAVIEIRPSSPYSETIEVKVEGRERFFPLGRAATDAVWVCAID